MYACVFVYILLRPVLDKHETAQPKQLNLAGVKYVEKFTFLQRATASTTTMASAKQKCRKAQQKRRQCTQNTEKKTIADDDC